ncbi:hypothetical protein CLV40_11443 [Actinokineospora auranticolor]|uniref:Uncharacterized protein n=1 Tax=Actinokineospora auranticolor TaxID=155976 RepID=A0A2S6GJR4_9PSEU|nr:hypothetical protein CLV40_11443 [Actinokineospora auranticolor]
MPTNGQRPIPPGTTLQAFTRLCTSPFTNRARPTSPSTAQPPHNSRVPTPPKHSHQTRPTRPSPTTTSLRRPALVSPATQKRHPPTPTNDQRPNPTRPCDQPAHPTPRHPSEPPPDTARQTLHPTTHVTLHHPCPANSTVGPLNPSQCFSPHNSRLPTPPKHTHQTRRLTAPRTPRTRRPSEWLAAPDGHGRLRDRQPGDRRRAQPHARGGPGTRHSRDRGQAEMSCPRLAPGHEPQRLNGQPAIAAAHSPAHATPGCAETSMTASGSPTSRPAGLRPRAPRSRLPGRRSPTWTKPSRSCVRRRGSRLW